MLRDDVTGTAGVLVPVKDLDKNQEVPTSLIANHLLLRLSQIKACENGYLLSVTKLISIEREDENPSFSHHIYFTVEFRCRTFLPVDGDILNGVVLNVNGHGIFLKAGPMNIVFLSSRLMPGYQYVSGKRPMYFRREDLSMIDKGMVIRFVVYAVRWAGDEVKEFKVLASIKGDGLGPVSLTGWDGLEL